MSATKTVGFVVLIGVGIYGVYYFLSKKVEGAEIDANKKIDDLALGLKGSVAGVIGSLGAGVKALAGGASKAGTAGAAASAAGAASRFVGPVKVATAGPGAAAAAGTGGVFSGMSSAGIAGFATVAALWVYTAFNKLFPKADPEWEAIERRLREARNRGEVILTKVSKSQLKAPTR